MLLALRAHFRVWCLAAAALGFTKWIATKDDHNCVTLMYYVRSFMAKGATGVNGYGTGLFTTGTHTVGAVACLGSVLRALDCWMMWVWGALPVVLRVQYIMNSTVNSLNTAFTVAVGEIWLQGCFI